MASNPKIAMAITGGYLITKQVVEGHLGSIHVETSSRGTTFVISLPL